MKTVEKLHRISSLLVGVVLLLGLSGCAQKEGGRVAVVLDNSGSMASAGTNFNDIKQSVFDSLAIVPASHESGLRVFDEPTAASRLVSPYSRDLDPLSRVLSDIRPESGTYIGQSLLDVTQDLLQKPQGDNRLIFITDGEGSTADIDAAREAHNRLSALQGDFKCHFVLFSTRQDVWNETPIGQVAETLGCKVTVPGERASAATLLPALLRIFGFDFYWIWIILSALAYLALIILTAYLVMDTQVEQGVLPRIAWTTSIGFVIGLILPVMGAHLIGLFAGLTSIIWGLTFLSLAIVIIAAIGIGKKHQQGSRSSSSDPFA